MKKYNYIIFLILLISLYNSNITFSQAPLFIDGYANKEDLLKDEFNNNFCFNQTYSNYTQNIEYPCYEQFVSKNKGLLAIENTTVLTHNNKIKSYKCYYNTDGTLLKINVGTFNNNDTSYSLTLDYSYSNNKKTILAISKYYYLGLNASPQIDTSIYYYSGKYILDSSIVSYYHHPKRLNYLYNRKGELIEIGEKKANDQFEILKSFEYKAWKNDYIEVFDFERNKYVYSKQVQEMPNSVIIKVTKGQNLGDSIKYIYNARQINTIDLFYWGRNQLSAIAAKWDKTNIENLRIAKGQNNPHVINTTKFRFGYGPSYIPHRSILTYDFKRMTGTTEEFGDIIFPEDWPQSITIHYTYENNIETKIIKF